jgi:hypothetical protein
MVDLVGTSAGSHWELSHAFLCERDSHLRHLLLNVPHIPLIQLLYGVIDGVEHILPSQIADFAVRARPEEQFDAFETPRVTFSEVIY